MQATRYWQKADGRDGIGVGSAGREVLQLDRKKLFGVMDTVTISTVVMPPCLHTYIVYLNIHHTSHISTVVFAYIHQNFLNVCSLFLCQLYLNKIVFILGCNWHATLKLRCELFWFDTSVHHIMITTVGGIAQW